MKISRTIRKQVMAGNSSNIRALLLTKSQISLVNMVEEAGSATTAVVADVLEVSVQNASAKLTKLYTAGYLEREYASAASGGVEYIYKRRSKCLMKP